MYGDYKDLRMLERILNVIIILEEDRLNIEDIDISYLRRFLRDEDIFVFYNMYKAWEITKLKCKVHKELPYSFKEFNNFNKIPIEWYTSYGILGIEEKEYSKEELLEIVKDRINLINRNTINKEIKNEQIDSILVAYNDIIKSTNKQR